jgi:hypothetical protein
VGKQRTSLIHKKAQAMTRTKILEFPSEPNIIISNYPRLADVERPRQNVPKWLANRSSGGAGLCPPFSILLIEPIDCSSFHVALGPLFDFLDTSPE